MRCLVNPRIKPAQPACSDKAEIWEWALSRRAQIPQESRPTGSEAVRHRHRIRVWGRVSSHKETAGQGKKALEFALSAVWLICNINLCLERGYMHSWINRRRVERRLLLQFCKTVWFLPRVVWRFSRFLKYIFSVAGNFHLWVLTKSGRIFSCSQQLWQSPKQTSWVRWDGIWIFKIVIIQTKGTHGTIKNS